MRIMSLSWWLVALLYGTVVFQCLFQPKFHSV